MEAGMQADVETGMEADVETGMEAKEEGASRASADEPIDVYLMAQRFSYVPSVLRLKAGQTYRFRMMSIDVNHGASIHTGFAGHIMRRPAMVLTEMEMTFSETGEFMMYCTVYCGAGHDQMKGKIIVE
jgi:heme/copper-type cytochrome/quinol oxidase subunit 2